MSENRFPSDPMQDLRELQRTVADDQATSGSQLLVASAGWVMRNRSTPPAPPTGDIHIYAQNGTLWATSASASVPLLPQNKAAFVAAVANADAGASYDSSAQALLNALKSKVNAILTELKIAALMNGS